MREEARRLERGTAKYSGRFSMLRSMFAKVLFGLCVLQGSLLTACSGDSPHESESAATGTLSLPLLTSAGAHIYRLQGAFYVYGPTFQYLDLNGDALTASLPTGNYQSELYGWQLTRNDGTGAFKPVDARLVSSSVQPFTIFNGTTSTVTFQFETDGLLVSVGSGTFKVEVDVTERPAVCTPLSEDCGAGAWCPPTELTAASAACMAEGPRSAGDRCSSPLDCAANTSCFDLGDGARCVPLCPRTDFDLPCASGGTCTPRAADYGVCVSAI
jgi:hypothetical protein